MTASTRSLLWLAVLSLGLLPLASDLDGPGTAAAWEQLAAWEDPENDTRFLREHLTRPHANSSFLHSCGLPSAAITPGDHLLPPKGGGILQGPALSRQVPRAPPIP